MDRRLLQSTVEIARRTNSATHVASRQNVSSSREWTSSSKFVIEGSLVSPPSVVSATHVASFGTTGITTIRAEALAYGPWYIASPTNRHQGAAPVASRCALAPRRDGSRSTFRK
jgi:hypothetical protein